MAGMKNAFGAMKRESRFLLAGLLLCAALPASQGLAQDKQPSAQSLLFDANYLLPLKAPSRLVYDYEFRTADPQNYGAGFQDQVALRLTPASADRGEKDVTVEMFSGDRQRVVGPLTQVAGNPIIMAFLERDVVQMSRQSGGPAVFYRNVIRLAFREKAVLEPATVSWQGRDVTGTKVTIQPFANEPNALPLQPFGAKTYTFTVSDAVPGGLYELRSTMPGADPGAKEPASDVRLTLRGLDHEHPNN